jgi:hypothetical protein
MSDGDTPQQAAENVMDAIACWIEAAGPGTPTSCKITASLVAMWLPGSFGRLRCFL